MTEVDVLYKCLVCGKAYGSKQALRGHMNAHRGKLKRTTIFVDECKWDEFKDFCKAHNTTTCHMLDSLLNLALRGKAEGIIEIAGPNPVIFNYTQVFAGKPRSPWKVDLTGHVPPGSRCLMCGSPIVRQWNVEFTDCLEGYCSKCGAGWMIEPHRYSKRTV